MIYDLCRRLTLIVASGLLLTNCASSVGKLTVNIEALKECQKLGTKVPVPNFDAQTDYAELSASALGTINRANRGSAARTRCEDKVIDDYAKAR